MKKLQDEPQGFEKTRRATLMALEKIDESTLLKLTRLTLPQIDSLRHEIARVLPVGNLPAFILDGLTKLKGRTVQTDQVERDLRTLFRGTSLMPQGLYGAFVAGPATVLYAYQRLLQLAGKDTDAAFPEGTWQFYLQFGLREDTARHTNETLGFYQAFPQVDPISAAAAWIRAIADFILEYDNLLSTDWTERVRLRLLLEIAQETEQGRTPSFARLIRDWNVKRPYDRPADGGPYLSHRHTTFRSFFNQRLALLPDQARQDLEARYQARMTAELDDYQKQMTLLCSLTPGRHKDSRTPIPIWRACIGFVWNNLTYMIPVCQRDLQGRLLCYASHDTDEGPIPLSLNSGDELTDAQGQPVLVSRGGYVWSAGGDWLLGRLRPFSSTAIKGWVKAIIKQVYPADSEPPSSLDLLLAASPRARQSELRASLSEATQAEIEQLRQAPVILNWDIHPADQPLPYVRRGRRGIGDHALTIFRTERSFVFDQSHILFDGLWGMATSELLTNEATFRYPLAEQADPRLPSVAPRPLKLVSSPKVIELARKDDHPEGPWPGNLGEAAAEDEGIQMRRLSRLRRWLRQRGAHLTVNDLLLLYRFLHAGAYRPSSQASQAIEDLRAHGSDAAVQTAVEAIEDCLEAMRVTNPVLLIPMDASNVAPRERIYPTTFRNPLVEIGAKITAAYQTFQAHRQDSTPRTWTAFDQARREMLAYLNAFGEVLNALKAVTMRGESFNNASIRMLAHLPSGMQHLLDQIPQRIGVLNEIIKGTEVFSNVGRVAPDSSLSRFSSARDDGQTKWLVWGILTDDNGVLHITLRDFRPFVPLLLALEEPKGRELAELLAQDYLHSYVEGFNLFVAVLGEVISEKGPATQSRPDKGKKEEQSTRGQ